MGGWFKREINTPEDIQGLSMRIPALGGQVFTRAGGNTQTIAAGEIFLALERGTVDAAEWVGPYDDEILGLHRAAPYYYGPAWQEPGPALGLYVNLDTFGGLPADVQQVIQTVAQAVNVDMLSRYEARNGAALERLIAGGTQVRTFPVGVMRHFEVAMNELHEIHRAANPVYARVYDDYVAFGQGVRRWGGFSEYPLQHYVHGG